MIMRRSAGFLANKMSRAVWREVSRSFPSKIFHN